MVTEVLDAGEIASDPSRCRTNREENAPMRLVETLKSTTKALKVREVADLLGVTPQHIYRMAATGRIPSFRISGSVRFDPEELATWLRDKQLPVTAGRHAAAAKVAA